METTADKISIMQSFADGKNIEFKSLGNTRWNDLTICEPTWNWQDYEYRVKPELKTEPLTQKEFLWLGVQYYKFNSRLYGICFIDEKEVFVTLEDGDTISYSYGLLATNKTTGINYKGEEVKLYKEIA